MPIARTPFTPIFKRDKKVGSIEVGATPPSFVDFEAPSVNALIAAGDGIVWAQAPTYSPPLLVLLDSDLNVLDDTFSPSATAMNRSIRAAGDVCVYTVDDPVTSGNYITTVVTATDGTIGTAASLASTSDNVSVVAVSPDANLAYQLNTTGFGVDNELDVIDISTPASPSVVATITSATHFQTSAGSPHSVVADNDYVYIFAAGDSTNGGRLTIYDVTTPSSPSLVSSTQFAGTEFDSDRVHLAVVGDYAYLPRRNFDGGYTTIDLTTRSAPVAVGGSGVFTTAPYANYDAFYDGVDHLAVMTFDSTDAGGPPGFWFFDITTPTAPVLDGSLVEAPDGTTISGHSDAGNAAAYTYIGPPDGGEGVTFTDVHRAPTP